MATNGRRGMEEAARTATAPGTRRPLLIISALLCFACGHFGYVLGTFKAEEKDPSSVACACGRNNSALGGSEDEFGPFGLVGGGANATIPRGRSPLKRIHLLGERISGTKFVESVLRRAFHPQYGPSWGASRRAFYPFSGCSPDWPVRDAGACSPVFRFKHMFRHSKLSPAEEDELRNRTDVLWILVVRSPCDWADGMYRRPWHMCHPNTSLPCRGVRIKVNRKGLKGVDRVTFFELPWRDNVEANSPDADGNDGNMSFSYPDGVFGLRAHKLHLMAQLVRAAPHRVKIAHLMNVAEDPDRFIRDLAAEFGLKINQAYAGQGPSKKKKWDPLPHTR